MTIARDIKKFAKKKHLKCKQKEFTLKKNRAAMANRLQKAKNGKTTSAIHIM